jgi:hypothetical protein
MGKAVRGSSDKTLLILGKRIRPFRLSELHLNDGLGHGESRKAGVDHRNFDFGLHGTMAFFKFSTFILLTPTKHARIFYPLCLSTFPGRAPVIIPRSLTTTPFTIVYSIPSG